MWASRLLTVIGLVATGLLGVAPAANAAPGSWSTASLGAFHSCGIRTSGLLYCWGENDDGQLGENERLDAEPYDYLDKDQPYLVRNHNSPLYEARWASTSAGGAHTCAITSNEAFAIVPGSLYCWGKNGSGRLGDGTTGVEVLLRARRRRRCVV